jgi:acyl carrier protein phosphodiesterase
MASDEYKQPIQVRGIYVYWFVTADKITSDQGARLWSLAKTMLEKRELERWAYISYFATCLPGRKKPHLSSLNDSSERRPRNFKQSQARLPRGVCPSPPARNEPGLSETMFKRH